MLYEFIESILIIKIMNFISNTASQRVILKYSKLGKTALWLGIASWMVIGVFYCRALMWANSPLRFDDSASKFFWVLAITLMLVISISGGVITGIVAFCQKNTKKVDVMIGLILSVHALIYVFVVLFLA